MVSVSSLLSTPRSTFSLRLEKHLDDYRKGHGDLSRATAGELSTKATAALSSLAHSDPRSMTLAGAYSSALRYDTRSRFLSNLSNFTEDYAKLTRAVAPVAPSEETQKPVTLSSLINVTA